MEVVPGDDFLKWAAARGITFDERYAGARCLGFASARDHHRFWTLPVDPADWPHFTASILQGLDDWSWGFLWPRCGKWPGVAAATAWEESVRTLVLRGAGIPNGWTGAVRFERGECGAVIAVLFPFLLFGWCVDDDLYFIPDGGRQLMQTNHHGVIAVACDTEQRITEFVEHMSRSGYALPTELPDETFKRPAWMKQ